MVLLIVKIRSFYTYVKRFCFAALESGQETFLKYFEMVFEVLKVTFLGSKLLSVGRSVYITFPKEFWAGTDMFENVSHARWLLMFSHSFNKGSVWMPYIAVWTFTYELVADIWRFFVRNAGFWICWKQLRNRNRFISNVNNKFRYNIFHLFKKWVDIRFYTKSIIVEAKGVDSFWSDRFLIIRQENFDLFLDLF